MAAEEILGKAVLELTGNLAPLTKSLEEGKAASEEMAASTSRGFRGGITKAAIPAAAAVAGLAIGLHKSIEAAQNDQVAEARLAAAYKTSGLNIDKYKDSIDKAETSSAKLGFKSEDVKNALGSLVTATGNSEQAVKLLANAQDLARFKNISLSQATKILTGTLAGNTRAARQLGLVIPPMTKATDQVTLSWQRQEAAIKANFPPMSKMTAQQKEQYYAQLKVAYAKYSDEKATAAVSDKNAMAARTIDMVNKKLGGQADAFANTAQGAKEKMGAEFQLLEINIGKVLLPVVTKLSNWLASFSELLVKHSKVVKIVIAVIGTLGTAILIVAAATKAWELAQWLLNDSLLANPIVDIVVLIGLLVVAIVEAWEHSQTFRDIVLGVWDDISSATKAFVSFFTVTLPGAFQAVKDWVKQHWPEIAVLLSGPFAPLVALATNGFGVRDKLEGAFQDALHWFTNTWSKVQDLVTQPFKDASSFIKGVPGDITNAFSKVGGWFNTAKGWAIETFITGPFDDAWKFIKGVPGDITTAFSDIKSGITKAFKGAGDIIVGILKTGPNALIGLLDNFKIPKIHINMPWPIPDVHFGPYGPFLHIPYLAEGGIVNSPTVAMIGERGPEAVVPLGKGLGGVNVTVNGAVGNHAQIAAQIGRELQKHMNRGLDFGLQGPVRLA